MNQPSSTITSASLAMMVVTVAWEVLAQFGIDARPTLVASTVTLAGALVGYFKVERVLERHIRAKIDAERAE